MLVPGHCLPQTWISRVQTLPGFHFLCSVFTNCILRTAVSEAVLQWWKGINLVSWPCDQSLLIFMQNSSSNTVSTSWFLNVTSRKFPRTFQRVQWVDSVLSLLRAWVQFLIWKLRSWKPLRTAEKKKISSTFFPGYTLWRIHQFNTHTSSENLFVLETSYREFSNQLNRQMPWPHATYIAEGGGVREEG